MKIAYLLMCHNNPKQIKRLINSLEDSGDFFVHVDKKSNIEEFKNEIGDNPNVFYADNRIRVNWAAWSMTQVYLDLLNQAYNSDKNYDRFVFLTGQDYPIMSNRQIIEEFEKNKEVEYIMAYKIATSTIPTDKNKILKRWYFENPFNNKFLRKCWYSFTYRFITKFSNRKKITVTLNGQEVDSYFGQMLSAFTRAGANELLRVYLNDKKYNKIMKHVHASVEHYWHTIIFNSPLRAKTIQKGEEHEITEHFGWAPLHYHEYVEYCSIYSEENYEELKNCGYMFFRKVVPGHSDTLMDKIDKLRKEN